MPIHAPKMGFVGDLSPKWKTVTPCSTKGSSLHRNTSFDVQIVEIGQMVAEISLFIHFQDGGRLPSWICGMRIWTTREEYLAVFIAVQSLVEIDRVIICTFSYFAILA